MSPDSAIVGVPLSTQLLAFAVLMQVFAVLAVLWRRIFGMAERPRGPRWPFIPLLLGTGAGVWYAWIQSDLVFGAAQGVALFVCTLLIINRHGRPVGEATGPARTPRTDKKAKRAARRAQKDKKDNGGN